MIMGMQSVWIMGDYSQITGIPATDVKDYLVFGGDVNGNETHAPRVVHYFDPDEGDEWS